MSRTPKVLTLTFACVRNCTVLRAEAALTCADAPAHGPQSLGVGEGASIELSEACSSVGQLEARASDGLLWPPYRKG